MIFSSFSETQTQQISEKIAQALHQGCFIALYGGLGAGKTAFVRGFVKGMQCAKPVSSPTFSLMNEYTGGRLPIYHFDLYRINSSEVLRLGFNEIFDDPSAVSIVEWSERLEKEILPIKRIEIIFTVKNNTERTIQVHPIGMELDL